ncbi:MAG: GNAT family N-acetyltransferase, partial [Veillonella sp.]|uniref:sterol carrier protein domain-containing protein n=1 Tax=Veillonella sp. TaxID=1926307 RepID=UPI0025DB1EB1
HIDAHWQNQPGVVDGKYTFTMGVKDSLATWNEGTYEVTIHADGHVAAVKKADAVRADVQFISEVGALSLILMGRLTVSELMFEDKVCGEEAVISMLNRVYPKQKTYINEWW